MNPPFADLAPYQRDRDDGYVRRQKTWRRSVGRAGAATLGSAFVTLSMAGCAPQALGFQHDDTIRQGFPLANAHSGWGGVDLENTSGSPVTLQSLTLSGLENARISHVEVIKVTPGNGIGFYPPPVTPGMADELAHARPLRGYVLPSHSGDDYEAVFLMTALDPTRDAASTTAHVTYHSGWSSWTETRHSAFCLFTRSGHGCDRD